MILNLINHLLPSIEHFRMAGYWVAFFSAFAETLFGIGFFFPGSTLILILGAVSARGHLDTGDLIWFAVLGAVLGDNLNYRLGGKYGAKWIQRGFGPLKPAHVENARHFLEAHGAKSIFLGRFIPGVKEVLPFLAGSLKMRQRAFFFWNLLGALGWSLEWILAGYLFARSLSIAELWMSRAGVVFAVLITFGITFYALKWLAVKKGKQWVVITGSLWHSIWQAIVDNEHVARWLRQHPRGIAFFKARLTTKAFSGLPLSISVVTFVYALALFTGIVEDFITSDAIMAADIRIANLFLALRTAPLTRIFTWITLFGKSQVVIAFIAILLTLLWLWRKNRFIWPLLIAVTGSETFTYLGKLAFHRPRPEQALYTEQSFSFPSGHATIAVAFYGFVGYLLMRGVRGWNKKLNRLFLTLLVIFAIGLSRVYLGVHYVSDVWSGYLVGSMWLIIAISFAAWRGYQKQGAPTRPPVRGAHVLSWGLGITGIVVYAAMIMTYHPQPLPGPVQQDIPVSDKSEPFSDTRMKYTQSLTGNPQEPINVIFRTETDTGLIFALDQAGWQATDKAEPSAFIKAIGALITNTPHARAPIPPSFWNAKIQDFGFAKVPGSSWLTPARHLRVWRTRFVSADGTRIYVGMVNATEGLRWGIIPKLAPDLDTQRELLYQDLQTTGSIQSHRKIRLVKSFIGKNFIQDTFFTDGKAYDIVLSKTSGAPKAK